MATQKDLALRGQLELSPPEVIAAYQKKLAYGWKEEEYLTYRSEWKSLPAQKIVREYPLEIGFQMTSACNLRCHMCTYSSEKKDTRKGDYIDFALIKKVIDEVADKVYSVKFGSFGEATLHPDLINAITYAKQKGVREVSLITNGSRLSESYSKSLINAGLDWLMISIDGLHDVYEKIRFPLKFEETLGKLKFIKSYKEATGKVKPVVKVSSVWPAMRPNPQLYYDTLSPLCDLVAFNPLCDLGANPFENPEYLPSFSCPHFWQRLFIGCDGKALLCCNDYTRDVYMGDVSTSTIHEIWHGPAFQKVREIHSVADGFKTMRPCNYCFMGLKTEFDEKFEVDGREIWVENFVGLSRDIPGI